MKKATLSEQEQAVEAWVLAQEITYEVRYTGPTERHGWKADSWVFSFKREGWPPLEFEYSTGLGHRTPAPKPTDGGPPPRRNTLMWERLEAQRQPQVPAVAGVLNSLLLDFSSTEQPFEDWCADFGYDSDSRKGLDTYLECQQNGVKLRKLLAGTKSQELEKLLEDY